MGCRRDGGSDQGATMTGAVQSGTAVPALRKGWQPPPQQKARSERTRVQDPSSPLQRISLELSRQCNLRCTFCYAQATAEPCVGLTDAEVRAVIDEAVALGACLISIVGGGESLLRRSILRSGESCIDYANKRGCYAVVYTNCTLVDREAARWLNDRDVTVVGKMMSLRDSVQDSLVGVTGASVKIRRGVDALIEAGLAATKPPRLALESVICRDNYDEMPAMWRWMRARGIVPEVEIPTMHGRATENRGALFFDEAEAPDKYRQLFEELLAIDRSEFGYDWIPHPPFVACSCQLYYSNCYVTDQGAVQPCASVDRVYGRLRVGANPARGKQLAEIVTSPDFLTLRRIHAL
ncbi:MAG: hypothetical protein DRI90_27370, partial [Deltaproteobacteria bacterium]